MWIRVDVAMAGAIATSVRHTVAIVQRHLRKDQMTRPLDAPNSVESRLIGDPIEENPDKARKASPITYITAETPPFLTIHGARDPVVPPHQSKLLYEALTAAGINAQLVIVKGAKHGAPRRKTDALVDAFFDKHIEAAGNAQRDPVGP